MRHSCPQARERERVDRAFHRSEELPPVNLYKVGGSYFVEDGNHRVSVARYHGAEWIDADVTEFRVPHLATPRPPGGSRRERVDGARGPSGKAR